MSKKKDDHPFYCWAKQCRKTAWDTPEYITDVDRMMMRQVLVLLNQDDADGLYSLFQSNRKATEDFFNRVIGWPEGFAYCNEMKYVSTTGMRMIMKYDLPKMEEYLKKVDNLVLTPEG